MSKQRLKIEKKRKNNSGQSGQKRQINKWLIETKLCDGKYAKELD